MTPERNVEPTLITENLDNEEIEQMINKIRKGEKCTRSNILKLKKNKKKERENQTRQKAENHNT